MAKNGFFTGLDIGTSSIKVIVAEFVNEGLNVIGVSNVPSKGIKDGVIIDIEAASKSISEALAQAEDKAGITIDKVSVGLPANQLQLEPSQGMIPIHGDSKEIRDEDVENVVKSALTKSLTPERDVIAVIPEEFILDGFKGIRDPRGMMGIRLEMRGTIYTGPATLIHNLKKTVEKAGVALENIIISPLALTKSVLNEGEREFGATVLDMGGGQTMVAVMSNQVLQYSDVHMEGSDYVTKDISKVLRTSLQTAENLKYSFGSADLANASTTEIVQVDVVGESQPVEITEHYLAEIITARIRQTLERIKQDLDRRRLADMPGGVVLTGGGAILPGVVELAQEIFGLPVKLHLPNQVGIRNPIFSNVMSLVEYAGSMSEVDAIAQKAVISEEMLRRKPIDFSPAKPQTPSRPASRPVEPTREAVASTSPAEEAQPSVARKQVEKPAKKNIGDKVRGFFGNMFD